MDERLRCRQCNDVIGVYEPLVVLHDGRAHNTSSAAELDSEALREHDCYHRSCYEKAARLDEAS